MIPFERQKFILEQLQKEPAYIEYLAKLLKVSEITIRRDLKTLEDEGVIEMKHGGMAKLIDTTKETTMQRRSTRFVDRKKIVGKKASELVKDGDFIFIDSGTTTRFMIKALKDKKVTIVTNGYENIELAMKYHIEIISLGGQLKRETLAFIGPEAINSLNRYHFDKCFLGANGVDEIGGITNADNNESIIKEFAIAKSTKSFILIDSSKFNKIANYKFAEMKAVTVITDEIPEKYQDSVQCKCI